jgi:hypothetical protein
MARASSSKKKVDELTVADMNPLPMVASRPEHTHGRAPLILLPPRREHSPATLTPASEQAATRELPTLAFLAHAAQAETANLPPPTMRVLSALFSSRLLEASIDVRERIQQARLEAQAGPEGGPSSATALAVRRKRVDVRKESKRTRIAPDAELVANYTAMLERVVPASAREIANMGEFYERADDGFDEETPFEGRDPASYPMMQAIHVQYYHEYAARDTHLEHETEGVPRPPPPPALLRQQLRKFRMKPREGKDRKCRLGEGCAFKRYFKQDVNMGRAYVGREFYLGDVPPSADTPLGPCIDDLLISWKREVHENLKQGYTPLRTINSFCVHIDGHSQYGPHSVMEDTMDARPTGFVGPVPSWEAKQREYREVDPADVILYELDPPETPGGKLFYLAEINVEPPASVRPPSLLPLDEMKLGKRVSL